MRLKLAGNEQFDISKPGFAIRAGAKSADVYIYESIGDGWMGGISAKRFADDIKALGKLETINVFMNSPGGSVFDGWAMYSTLKRNSARINVQVDGLAASIASLVAMAGDEITMADNSLMMIHNAWADVRGDAEEMRTTADLLDKISGQLMDTYAARSGNERDLVQQMMAEETWMTADEAMANGFCDCKSQESRMAACAFDLSRFKNAPQDVVVKAPQSASEPSLTDQIASGYLYLQKRREKSRKN